MLATSVRRGYIARNFTTGLYRDTIEAYWPRGIPANATPRLAFFGTMGKWTNFCKHVWEGALEC